MLRVDATCTLRGTLHGRAFTGPKESLGWAIEALVDDLIGSLETRLRMAAEEQDEIGEEDEEEGERDASALPLDDQVAIIILPFRYKLRLSNKPDY